MLRRLLSILVLVGLPSLAWAAEIPYTGNLSESGAPVTGNRFVQLSVYDVPSGGSALHTQAESLAVSGGVFHALLVVPDATWFGGERWIGISVNGSSELSPRIKYRAAPRPQNQLVERPSLNRSVTSTTWVKLDSLTISSAAGGHVVLTHTGVGTWTGSGQLSAIFPLLVAMGPTTPSTYDTLIQPAHTGSTSPVNFTVFKPVNAGTTVLYLWARVTDQPYSLVTQRFQALQLPN